MKQYQGIQDLACLALLAVVVGAFFWPLFCSRAWIPRGGGDLVSFLWPMYRFAARTLRSGTVPLWNPHLHSGMPLIGDNQAGLFYPINLLTFAILGPPSYAVMEGLVVFHIWLAAAAMFALLRGLRLGRPAAVSGSLAFALSDLFLTHIGNLNLNATAAWLPLLLWLTHRALDRRSAWCAAVAGAVLAVAALAGHGQILLLLGLTLGLYVLYRVLTTVPHPPGLSAQNGFWQRAGRVLGLAFLIAAVGVGGSALALLPTYQMAGHTARAHLSYQEATRYSLPPRALIGLIAPGFYGRGSANFWGSWDRVEVGYAGVATLALAAVALSHHVSRYLSRRPRSTAADGSLHQSQHRFPLAFFALLIPLALLVAMGRFIPLYRLLYRYVPAFDQIRAPARAIVLADFGLAALAAYGLDRLMRDSGHQRFAPALVGVSIVAASAALVVVGLPRARTLAPADRATQAVQSIAIAAALLAVSGVLVFGTQRWKGMGWVFPVLLAVDLVGLGSTLEIERSNPTLGFDYPDVVAFLREDSSLFRIGNTAQAWQPDAALMHGLYDIGGVYNPLGLAPYQAYRWAVGEPGTPLYNLLGVKYILADRNETPNSEHLVPIDNASADIDIYLNTAVLPRALFVTCQQVVSDHEAAWQAVHNPTFNPARTVVLEQQHLLDTIGLTECASSAGGARISFAIYRENAIELNVRSPVEGWLVLSDVYYPGWQARVDGARTPVLRANYTFRAIRVPPGDHSVQLTFAPWTWRAGLALSLATWLGLATGATLKLWSLRRKAPWPSASQDSSSRAG